MEPIKRLILYNTVQMYLRTSLRDRNGRSSNDIPIFIELDRHIKKVEATQNATPTSTILTGKSSKKKASYKEIPLPTSVYQGERTLHVRIIEAVKRYQQPAGKIKDLVREYLIYILNITLNIQVSGRIIPNLKLIKEKDKGNSYRTVAKLLGKLILPTLRSELLNSVESALHSIHHQIEQFRQRTIC